MAQSGEEPSWMEEPLPPNEDCLERQKHQGCRIDMQQLSLTLGPCMETNTAMNAHSPTHRFPRPTGAWFLALVTTPHLTPRPQWSDCAAPTGIHRMPTCADAGTMKPMRRT